MDDAQLLHRIYHYAVGVTLRQPLAVIDGADVIGMVLDDSTGVWLLGHEGGQYGQLFALLALDLGMVDLELDVVDAAILFDV